MAYGQNSKMYVADTPVSNDTQERSQMFQNV